MMQKKVDMNMRGLSVFVYSARQGLKSMKKNKMFTVASVSTIAACLFLFGMFYFVVSNFQNMIREMESSVGLSVFFDEGASEELIESIGDAIKLRSEVEKVEFISAEQAWENFKKDNFADDQELIDSFGNDNPLEDSASYQVYINDIAKQKEVANYISGIEGVRLVNSSNEAAENLENANGLISFVSIAIISILLAVSIFLINSTISTGITIRRQEIGIMRLMGASDFFIRAPFIVEGVVIGLIGACIPLVILVFSYTSLVHFFQSKFTMLNNVVSFLGVGEIFKILTPICLLIGIGIGFIGSFVTVHRHLNV